MNKIVNPFFNFDASQFMGEFDPTKMLDEFSKMAGQYNLPGVDVDGLIKSQQKNVEALTVANKMALEGLQAIAKRQAEILQDALEQAQGAVESLSSSGTPQDAAAKQAELAKFSFEKALNNMRELAEMAAKSSTEATGAINARISEGLDEARDMALSLKK